MDYTIFLTSLVALVLYLNTLDADFAYDDSRAIQKNQDLLPETPLINVLYDDFWGTPLTHSGSHKSYRPICVLTFRLNYYFGELNPWGYHLGNVLFHVLATAIFTYLARHFLWHTFPTLVAGMLFAAHPVHTEAVAGIVGRADVGACIFFLLAFLSYVKYVDVRESGTNGARLLYFLGTGILTSASMLTKEQGITVLAVCFTYDVFIVNKLNIPELLQILKSPKSRRCLEGILGLGIFGLGLIAFRLYFMGNKPPDFAPSDNPTSSSESFLTRTLTYFLLPALNFWMLLCPRILSFDWSMEAIPLVENMHDIRNIYSVAFYGGLTYMAYYILCSLHNTGSVAKPHLNGNGIVHNSTNSSKYIHSKIPSKQAHQARRGSSSSTESSEEFSSSKRPAKTVDIVILSIALIVFPFIPATNMFFYVGFVIAERVLYIPSMGLCLLVAHGAYLLYKRLYSEEQKRKLLVLVFAILICLFGFRTVLRNRDWQTEERLYYSGISVNPAKAWGNLANILNSQGKAEEAEHAYRSALTHRGNMADVHYNLGILLQDQRRYSEAIESYKKAIQCRPKLSLAHLNLAILTAQEGRFDEAEKIYRHCADLDTSGLKDPRLHDSTKISCLYNLGRMLSADLDRNPEALEVYQESLRRRPSHYPPQSIYNMMGEVYLKLGQDAEAEHWYHEALKVKPDHLPAHLTIAKLFQKKNQFVEAEEWFKKAIELDPNDILVDHHYAQFLAETNRLSEAAERYMSAASKAPDDFELIFNSANALRQVGINDKAEELYKKAVDLRPHIATPRMNLGAMYHFNGKLLEAESSYLAALRLKPDDEMTKQNLAKLRNLIASEASKGKSSTARVKDRT